jgi:hypothetical protein
MKILKTYQTMTNENNSYHTSFFKYDLPSQEYVNIFNNSILQNKKLIITADDLKINSVLLT